MSTSKTIVNHEAWTDARVALLAREKAFMHERDALSAARRNLPAEKVTKSYVFEEAGGKRTLADLFDGKKQLVVYHFMFDPSWEAGCKSCSYIADGFDGAVPHLRARDTSLVAISRAPIAKIDAFKARMGWTFRWLSSGNGDFNYDYNVSFRPEDVEAARTEYNYKKQPFPQADAPGLSVFLRQGDDILHTYSTYARGLDPLMAAYQFLDLTPIGRNEGDLPHTMTWVRHHDKYDAK